MKNNQKLLNILRHQKILLLLFCMYVCMYKMSGGAERLTKERKITVKTNTK